MYFQTLSVDGALEQQTIFFSFYLCGAKSAVGKENPSVVCICETQER